MYATGSLGSVTTWEDWVQPDCDFVDDSNEQVNITGASIEIAVRKQGSCSPSLEASVGNGITIASPLFTFVFTESQMNGLSPGTYDVGVRVKLNGETTWVQSFVGTVIVADGVGST